MSQPLNLSGYKKASPSPATPVLRDGLDLPSLGSSPEEAMNAGHHIAQPSMNTSALMLSAVPSSPPPGESETAGDGVADGSRGLVAVLQQRISSAEAQRAADRAQCEDMLRKLQKVVAEERATKEAEVRARQQAQEEAERLRGESEKQMQAITILNKTLGQQQRAIAVLEGERAQYTVKSNSIEEQLVRDLEAHRKTVADAQHALATAEAAATAAAAAHERQLADLKQSHNEALAQLEQRHQGDHAHWEARAAQDLREQAHRHQLEVDRLRQAVRSAEDELVRVRQQQEEQVVLLEESLHGAMEKSDALAARLEAEQRLRAEEGAAAASEVARLRQEADDALAEMSNAKEALQNAEEELVVLRARATMQENALAGAEEAVQVARAQLAEHQQRLFDVEADGKKAHDQFKAEKIELTKSHTEQLEQLKTEMEALRHQEADERQSLSAQLESEKRALEQSQRDAKELGDQLAVALRDLAGLQFRFESLEGDLGGARAMLEAEQLERKKAADALNKAQQEAAGLRAERTKDEAARAGLAEELRQQRERRHTAEAQLSAQKAALASSMNEMEEKLVTLTAALRQANEEKEAQGTELKALEEAERGWGRERSSLHDSVRALSLRAEAAEGSLKELQKKLAVEVSRTEATGRELEIAIVERDLLKGRLEKQSALASEAAETFCRRQKEAHEKFEQRGRALVVAEEARKALEEEVEQGREANRQLHQQLKLTAALPNVATEDAVRQQRHLIHDLKKRLGDSLKEVEGLRSENVKLLERVVLLHRGVSTQPLNLTEGQRRQPRRYRIDTGESTDMNHNNTNNNNNNNNDNNRNNDPTTAVTNTTTIASSGMNNHRLIASAGNSNGIGTPVQSGSMPTNAMRMASSNPGPVLSSSARSLHGPISPALQARPVNLLPSPQISPSLTSAKSVAQHCLIPGYITHNSGTATDQPKGYLAPASTAIPNSNVSQLHNSYQINNNNNNNHINSNK